MPDSKTAAIEPFGEIIQQVRALISWLRDCSHCEKFFRGACYRESGTKGNAAYVFNGSSPHECAAVFRNDTGTVMPHGCVL